MSTSNNTSTWCNTNNWFLNEELTVKSPTIPRNEIDDVTISSAIYTYSIIDNQCFNKIPYIDCNNLKVVVGSDVIGANIRGDFRCETLQVNNLSLGSGVDTNHWSDNTYCKWTVSSFSGLNNRLNLIIFQGLDYFELLNDGQINNCYIQADKIHLSGAQITTTDSYNTKLIINSGVLFNTSGLSNNIHYIGSFLINSGSYIAGTGQGDFIFENSQNNATINGSALFNSGSINLGTIYSNTCFSGGAVNSGVVVGDCIFIDMSQNFGTISGTATFTSGSLNSGLVTKYAIFDSGTQNYGRVKNYSTFNHSFNTGTLENGAKFIGSTNAGSVSGSCIFESGSINHGNIAGSGAQFSFDLNSINAGSLSGTAFFGSGCFNTGTILYASGASVTFNKNSYNSGIIEANQIVFKDTSYNQFNINITNGNIRFQDFAINYSNILSKNVINSFYNFSVNLGTGYTTLFYNSAQNFGSVFNSKYYNKTINSGQIFNTGLFYNGTYHASGVTGVYLEFNDQSINSGVMQSGRFYNSSQNYGIINSHAIFFDRSQNCSGSDVYNPIFFNRAVNLSGSTIHGVADFWTNSINNATITGCSDIRFLQNSTNNSNIINANICFCGLATNNGFIDNGNFYEFSTNNLFGSGNKINFLDESKNNGYITTSGNFFHKSKNSFLGVINNSYFYNESTNEGSMRRSLTSGYEALTTGDRSLVFLGYSTNKASLYNTTINFYNNSLNEGSIIWNFDNSIVFTSSGIYSTGLDLTTDSIIYIPVTTGQFLANFSDASIPIISFNDNSVNKKNIIGYKNITFNNFSKNYGNIITYPPVGRDYVSVNFNGLQTHNYGSIQNKANFNNSINYGDVGSASFERSINSGSVLDNTGIILFSTNSINYGLLLGYSSFNQSINFGTINNYASFNNNSTNWGPINLGAEFNNSDNIGGDINGNLIMTNGLCLAANIRGEAIFNHVNYVSSDFFDSYASTHPESSILLSNNRTLPNKNVSINKKATFIDSSNYGGSLLDMGIFNNSENFGTIEGYSEFINSDNQSGAVLKGMSLFSINSNNYGTIIAKTTQIPDINYATNWANYISELQYNYPLISGLLDNSPKIIFRFDSMNQGVITSNNTIFFSGINNGIINGDAIFIGSSHKDDALITGDAMFIQNSCKNDSAQILGQTNEDGTLGVC